MLELPLRRATSSQRRDDLLHRRDELPPQTPDDIPRFMVTVATQFRAKLRFPLGFLGG
jgi:hypothetical protein